MAYSIRTTSNFFQCGLAYAFFWWALFALYCVGYQINKLRVYMTRQQRIDGKDKTLRPVMHSKFLSSFNMVIRIPFVTEMIAVKHILGMTFFTFINIIFMFYAPFAINPEVGYKVPAIGQFDRRAAFVAMVNWGFVFFLAQRNSLLPKMSGLTVEELLPYHRWIARVGLAEFMPHFVWRIIKGYQRNNSSFESLFRNTEQTTGTISMFGFLIMFVTSFEYVRRNHFEVFYYSHIFGVLVAIIFACWHETTCFAFFIPAVILWFADRVIRSYQSWYIKSSYVKVEQVLPYSSVQEGIVRILFENSGLNRFKPGQYMFVSIVKDGGRKIWEYANWHPLTVSETFRVSGNQSVTDSAIEERVVGNTDHHIAKEKKASPNGSVSDVDSVSDVSELRRRANNFSKDDSTTIASVHIKALGGKTRDLLKAAEANEKLTVRFDGPYGPHLEYQDYEVMALYGAGIGVTPALAIVKDCLERRADGVKTVAVEHIYLTWAIRASDEINPFMDMFSYWSEKAKNAIQPIKLHVTVFVTRMNEGPDYFEGMEGFEVVYGTRPDIAADMDKIKTTNSRQTVWAHACGSFLFTRTVINEAIRHDFDVHNETFEF
ncbi:ferric reductase like transmembrane component-domain-containing protein [Mucor mucedo]|uniref:ferric reductase like transmembrane component-domain-containing protein n=1 Tax=Mucor mucedo TaxID=29922 RepID=UPI00221F69A8|nr:ferric reductase like transmembrane component-domain-containing protein [Mucor mucedo]KAI7893164.1 ferric reductase like transmembrane component-domain-containing protein [Mucor mucedo]